MALGWAFVGLVILTELLDSARRALGARGSRFRHVAPGATWRAPARVLPGSVPAARPSGSGVATATRDLTTAERAGPWWLWSGYLAVLVVAELVVVESSPLLGMGLHLAMLLALPIHAAMAPSRQQPLLLALMFAPLVRLVSLAMPLAGLPTESWWVLTSIPLFVVAVPIARTLGLSWAQLGLRVGSLWRQGAIALVGVPLAIVEYAILRPSPTIPELSWRAAVVPALVLLVSTGFLEELIFRGVLQTTALQALGRWGLVYVAAVFAALHIGYQSAPDVLFVFAVGLIFAWLVARSGSLLGVTLAHGATNTGLYVVLPLLAAQLDLGSSIRW